MRIRGFGEAALARLRGKVSGRVAQGTEQRTSKATVEGSNPSASSNGTAIHLVLPYPPTTNHYAKHGVHGHYMTAEARAWRDEVVLACRVAQIRPLLGPLAVELELYPPNRARSDIDNRIKAVLDAMQHGGCYPDDFAIDHLCVTRHEPIRGGRIEVLVWRI